MDGVCKRLLELVRKCTEGPKSGNALDKNRGPETDIQMERKRRGGGGGPPGWIEDVINYFKC
jgi:hypothetical protein